MWRCRLLVIFPHPILKKGNSPHPNSTSFLFFRGINKYLRKEGLQHNSLPSYKFSLYILHLYSVSLSNSNHTLFSSHPSFTWSSLFSYCVTNSNIIPFAVSNSVIVLTK